MNEEFVTENKPEVKAAGEQSGFLPKEALKRPVLSLLSLFVAGAVMMLLWWQVGGLGMRWPLSVLVVCGLYLFNTHLQERKVPLASWLLLGLTLLTSLIPVVRSEGNTVMLSMLMTLFCLALLTASFFGGSWWQYRFREYLRAALLAMAGFFVGFPIIASQASSSPKTDTARKDAGKRLALGILKGILISVPLLLIFTFLFAYADAVFESRLDHLLAWLRADFLSQLFGRSLLTLFFTWLLAAALWLLVVNSSQPTQIEPDKPLLKPFLGMTESTITLVGLNLLFAFFIIIQFQYFFAGGANINQEGFTYAQYAERGFRELLFVAAIAGMVYYTLASLTRRESKAHRLTFALLAGLLLLQVAVVLISAYQRIVIYINAYGLTAYRLIPQIFIFFLAAVLLCLPVMEWGNQFKRLALVLAMAALLFTFSLAAINVDTVLARHNITRALDGHDLDYAFLNHGLSTDAEPYLFDLVNSDRLPSDLQENLEKILVCRSASFNASLKYNLHTWLDATVSNIRVQALYQENQDILRKWTPQPPEPDSHFLGFTIDNQNIFCLPLEDWDETEFVD